MQIKIRGKSVARYLFLLATGAVAGFVNGLLGAGGGILIVWALSRFQEDTSADAVRDTFAATLTAVIPITLVSALRYTGEGHISPADLSPLLIPAIGGGLLGAWLLSRLGSLGIKKLFAALLIVSGILMLVR